MSERKPEWAVNLSTALKSWIPEHGYKATIQLANELDIPRSTWRHIIVGNAILAGEGRDKKFDGRFFYARIHLWTELAAADPRDIPDRSIRLPGGGVVFKKRNLSEEDYQKWLTSPEAQALLGKRGERFKRELILEQTELQPKESPQPTQPETVGSFLGAFIDDIIEKGADQIATILLKHQSEVVAPQLSVLDAVLDDRINALEHTITKLVASYPTSPRGSRTITTNDIGQLAHRLRDLLDGYKLGVSQDRDNLMQNYGKDLMALDIIVHTLTRRPEERESLLKLSEETKL